MLTALKSLYTLLSVLVLWQMLRLPSQPSIDGDRLTLAMIVSLTLLGLYTLSLSKRLSKNIVGYICFSLALLLVATASYPSSKTILAAKIETEARAEAGKLGIELAEQIKSNSISRETALETVRQTAKYTDIAETALNNALKEQADETSILADSSKLIDLKFNEWNCNKFGCAFTDNAYVWTIGQNNLLLGRIVGIFTIAILLNTILEGRKLATRLKEIFGK